MELRGRVAQNGKREVLGIHSATIVLDQDEIGAACGCRISTRVAPAIERVLDQLLDRTRGALDHLARCDTVDRALGETTDTRSVSENGLGAWSICGDSLTMHAT